MNAPDAARSPLSPRARRLRARLFSLLREQGFRVGQDHIPLLRNYQKDQIRRIHATSRTEVLAHERPFVREWLPRLFRYFASGSEVSPSNIDPYPVLVEDDEEMAALFRLACLWWSVPVSRGFGRRFRILVFDKSNEKLLGLLALTDPVFNLTARDRWVGWGANQREERLAHVMDAYVLGAVPPYNSLLGAKFVALLAASDYTRSVFRLRYRTSTSVIRRREFDGRLAMVTATSALGPSSIYNRLRFAGVDLFLPVGFTQGYGHFHIANGTYERLREYLEELGEEEVTRYKFGNGPNYKIRVIRKALESLRLPGEMLRHGIRRAVHVAPLAENAAAFLRGESQRLQWYRRPLEDIVEFWRDRWMLPRAYRDSSYRGFDRGIWKLMTGL